MQTLRRDNAVLVALQHVLEILLRLAEEQEHIRTGGNRARHQLAARGAAAHAHHVGGIGQNQAVKAQLPTQQILHQLRGEGCGQDLAVL